MPHFTIEYSANLEPLIRMPEMMVRLRDAAIATGVFAPSAIRVRAEPRAQFLLADGNPANAFVHILARIRPGRDHDTKQRVGDAMLAAMNAHLEAAYAAHPLAVLVEIQDMSPSVFLTSTLSTQAPPPG